MHALELVIGNKNYSSWSMRPWVVLRQAGVPFREILLRFDSAEWDQHIRRFSPTGRVPVLWIDGDPVWDSLAICEAVAELYPDRGLWPADPRARRLARSMCAEMHAGFSALRSAMPMNLRGAYPGRGMSPAVAADIQRLVESWAHARATFGAGGELLFGGFTIADAYYAPVVTRFATYGVDLPPEAARYCAAVRELPAVAEWCAAGRAETEVVPEDEPYAQAAE